MSECHPSYQGAATSRKQRPSDTDANCGMRIRMAPWLSSKDAGSHDIYHQKQGTQQHSASHHPHACLVRERADAGNPCHAQPPAHLNGQRISTKPEMKQAAHASVTFEQMKVWLWHRTNACKAAMIRARLGRFGGRSSRGSMQALPDLMRFASSMATKAGLVNENRFIMSKRRWQAQ